MLAYPKTMLLAGFCCIAALSAVAGEKARVIITPSGMIALDVGQVVRGAYTGSKANYVWQQRLLGQLGTSALLNERLSVSIAAECQISFSYPQFPNQYETQLSQFTWYLDRAYGRYAFGNPDQPPLTIDIGYLPFKYNPQVRNLGEYLFRTGAYPGYIINDFDYPQARLLGLHLGSSLFNL